jgi:leucyl-tRNA---protein transferase
MSVRGYLLGESQGACPYIAGNNAVHEQLVVDAIDEEELDALLAAGYRHFGSYFFRPVCAFCHQCVPLRIPVDRYAFPRSGRRLLNRGKRFLVTLEHPRPSHDAYKLYLRHKLRFAEPGERRQEERYEDFVETFFHPFAFSYQLSIYDDGRLISVAHLDMTSSSISAIYCYYDDRYTRESLGSLSIFREIEIAKERGLKWVYLGYYVAANRHMSYKARYAPNEVLLEEGKWIKLLDPGESFHDNIDKTGKVEFIPKSRLRAD